MASLLEKVSLTGCVPGDPPHVVLQKRFLNYQSLFMTLGAVAWVLVTLAAHREWQSLIHLAYVSISLLNYVYFRQRKNFAVAKATQTSISILLPFAFQWTMGGFWASGMAMLAALLGLSAAVTYTDWRGLIPWVLVYMTLVGISIFFDQTFHDWALPNGQDNELSLTFLGINIILMSGITAALVKLIVAKKAHAFAQLRSTQSELMRSKQLAALGKLVAEKEKAEVLLRNILPEQTAQELKTQGASPPRSYGMVTILFTDFVGFTHSASALEPAQLVSSLEEFFNGFDEIIARFRLEKIKTIGDSYMAAGGIPKANTSNAEDAIEAAFAMMDWVKEVNKRRLARGEAAGKCASGSTPENSSPG